MAKDGLHISDIPIVRAIGSTPAERYLQKLCDRSFLSLWSYARPFRNQGGYKEICDLVVIMGDEVIIFSDKHCLLTPKKTLEVDWARWFRAAVKAGAIQAWGAERWIREHPDRVFLDPECTRRLPVPLPSPERARYHLVVTLHGVAAACHAMLGGSGSLMLRSDVRGLAQHKEPFVIGDLDPTRRFVHVFDDTTLDVVMETLDTTPDFLRYLREKERFIRSHSVFAAGEENLLALYLAKVDENEEHAFSVDKTADLVVIDESWWPNFVQSPERQAQREHDQVSYMWDHLIERFVGHALAGTQHFASEPALESSEKILRFMAAETRLRRRYLSQQLLDAIEQTPPDLRRLRVAFTQHPQEPMYVFLLFPWRRDRSAENNRAVRRNYLEACMRVAKFKNRSAEDIIGIATESGLDNEERSEDAIYFDARHWTEEDDRDAQELQENLDILTAHKVMKTHIEEYPVGPRRDDSSIFVPKNPRNEPCACGSGRKFKRCHGR